MNELLSTVQNYPATKDTDYAIMINGGGCGKTYFYKKEISQMAESMGLR